MQTCIGLNIDTTWWFKCCEPGASIRNIYSRPWSTGEIVHRASRRAESGAASLQSSQCVHDEGSTSQLWRMFCFKGQKCQIDGLLLVQWCVLQKPLLLHRNTLLNWDVFISWAGEDKEEGEEHRQGQWSNLSHSSQHHLWLCIWQWKGAEFRCVQHCGHRY